ncbi:MAG: flagellar brake protein [Oscillospiraceae bacterium]|nr:flagellar brake protein [Oscillospiraceae bacterium]
MEKEELLVIGDKVDLLGHQNRLYRSMIEDVAESRFFLVGVPRFGGVPMPLHLDDSIFMVFYRESGRFITEMQVARFENRGDVRYIWLFQKTAPVKNQRREAFRVPTIVDVEVCQYVEGLESDLEGTLESEEFELVILDRVTSRDISLTGMALISDVHEYEVGQKYLLRMYLGGVQKGEKSFHTCATVNRILPWRDSGKRLIGVKFHAQTKEMSEQVSRYVLEEQRRQLKQKRLIEN